MAVTLSRTELQKQVEKMSMEANALHDWLMDLSIYSDGAISYIELLQMPMSMVKRFQDRLQIKIDNINGNKKKEKMIPGQHNHR